MREVVLAVRAVSKIYRRGPVEAPAVRDVTFVVPAGSAVAITGPSGSGKSTLLNLIAGLDRPSSGMVEVCGQRVSELDPEAATAFRRRHIGFVFQFFNLLPEMTAADNVALPLLAEGLPRRTIAHRAAETLDAVGIAHLGSRRPEELSGGEQQRVAVARALVMRPRLLLADEPTGALDTATGEAVLRLLVGAVERDGVALVLVTHSPAVAGAVGRELALRDGMVVRDVTRPASVASGLGHVRWRVEERR